MKNLYYYNGKTNAGDFYSYLLFNKLGLKCGYSKYEIDFCGVGSILQRKNIYNENTLVFSSGYHCRKEYESLNISNPNNYIAVRGLYTKNKLEELGLSNLYCSYGDGGLLISKIYNKEVKKEFDFGIVSSHQNYDKLKELVESSKYKDRIRLIDIRTNFIEELVNEIRSCRFILSSSLHGIIFSHSYNISSVHLLDKEMLESMDCFKYKDYYSVLDIDYTNEDLEQGLDKIIEKYYNEDLDKYCPSELCITSIQNALLSSFTLLKDKLYNNKFNSVMCVIAKNEHLYINDWVKHYIDMGFERIYLFDNDNISNDFVGNYIEDSYKDKVVIFNRRGIHKQRLQTECYNWFYSNFKDTFNWCMICDVDEYLDGVNNINDFLNTIDKDIEQVRIKWNLYGDDNLISRDTLIPIFKYFKEIKKDNKISNQGKCIIKGGLDSIKFNSVHYAHREIKGVRNKLKSCLPSGNKCNSEITIKEDYSNENIFLNHYMTKTLSEFIEQKFGRGDAVFKDRSIDLDYYWRINDKTKEKLDWLREKGLIK